MTAECTHLVVLAENPLEPATWTTHEVPHVGEFLLTHFDGRWPDTARIYHRNVAESCDVTPKDEHDVRALEEYEGSLVVVVYPGDPITIIVAIVAVIAIAAVLLAILIRPTSPSYNPSPNNSLSSRQNTARPNQRVPDIYGTLRATPDLIAAPYSVFVGNSEVEYTSLCIGRGTFTVLDVRDDVTPIQQVDGSSVEVWGPYTSPNSGDQPQMVIGSRLTQPMLAMSKSNVINGQELVAPNANRYTSSHGTYVSFWYGDTIIVQGGSSPPDLTGYFQVGNEITVSGSSNANGDGINLDGTYSVLGVSSDTIVLANPGLINPAWNQLADFPNQTTGNTNATISTASEQWVGPYILTQPVDLNTGSSTQNTVICNFVCVNGLYTVDSSGNQGHFDVQVVIGVTQMNPLTNVAFGPEYLYYGTVYGSSKTRLERAATIQVTTPFVGPCQVRARRVSDTQIQEGLSVTDVVQWRDFYAGSPVTVSDFGGVTTLYCQTTATQAALTPTNRKLNCLVTRNLPTALDTTSPGFGPSNNLADTFCAIAMDQYLGNLPPSQLDIAGIYATAREVRSYFGCDDVTQFAYTFDKADTSFEEMLIQLGNATFVTPYRQGSTLKLAFERQTSNSILLFNHRNKMPGSETRTVSFGTESNYDGVTYDFVSPVDDSLQTFYIPQDRTAVNPTHITAVGVRSPLQAYLQAYRVWNKIRYQNVQAEFEALQEANLLVRTDRVLVADNTRSDTLDGEVVSQNVLQLELSQPAALDPDATYTIFLQHPDGSVEGIPMTAGDDQYHVVLAAAPSQPLVLDYDGGVRTTYLIAGSGDARTSAMLVTKKEPVDFYVTKMTCVNYDDRYYQNDSDYITGKVVLGASTLTTTAAGLPSVPAAVYGADGLPVLDLYSRYGPTDGPFGIVATTA